MRLIMRTALVTLFAASLACGGDGGSGPSGLKASTTYRGVITATNGATAGLLLTFNSAVAIRVAGAEVLASAVIPVTGTVTPPGGGTVNLTGTLDNTALTMTGGGYTLTGTLKSGQFTGTFTGPGGTTGSFAAMSSTDVTPAYAYCGSYAGIITPGNTPEDGTFNLVLAGTFVSGAAVGSSGGEVVTFKGSAAPGPNGTVKITVNETSVQGTLKASGATSGDFSTVSGTYQTTVLGENATNNGTFEGSLCPGVLPTLQ